MIKVCDSIMGSGKTESAISYMNEHKDKKFIFITPYLSEATRIRNGCPTLHFIEPSDKLSQYNFRKSEHTAALIKEGRNITTTHQAFKRYTPDTLEDIKRLGYTLIVDENVDVLEACEFHAGDVQLAIEAGYIEEHDGVCSIAKKGYDGNALRELFTMLKSRELFKMSDSGDGAFYYWALPPDLFTSFENVFVLTYLFEGQSLHHFMKIYDIEYEYIGIERTKTGGYRFGKFPGYIPDYVYSIGDKLHIIEQSRMNDIGDDHYALSMNWFKKSKSNVDQLRRNISNCFNNVWRDVPANRKLWGSYVGECSKIRGKGYTKSFLTFNAKATNEYRGRDCLVYIANLFMNINEKKFYMKHGIEVDEDMYALSIMVQWIWRSAIRDGNEIFLYIPSSRMRGLLQNWIESLNKGGAA